MPPDRRGGSPSPQELAWTRTKDEALHFSTARNEHAHPNVLRLFGCEESPTAYYLALELCVASLHDLVAAAREPGRMGARCASCLPPPACFPLLVQLPHLTVPCSPPSRPLPYPLFISGGARSSAASASPLRRCRVRCSRPPCGACFSSYWTASRTCTASTSNIVSCGPRPCWSAYGSEGRLALHEHSAPRTAPRTQAAPPHRGAPPEQLGGLARSPQPGGVRPRSRFPHFLPPLGQLARRPQAVGPRPREIGGDPARRLAPGRPLRLCSRWV